MNALIIVYMLSWFYSNFLVTSIIRHETWGVEQTLFENFQAASAHKNILAGMLNSLFTESKLGTPALQHTCSHCLFLFLQSMRYHFHALGALFRFTHAKGKPLVFTRHSIILNDVPKFRPTAAAVCAVKFTFFTRCKFCSLWCCLSMSSAPVPADGAQVIAQTESISYRKLQSLCRGTRFLQFWSLQSLDVRTTMLQYSLLQTNLCVWFW